ncbi:MAG: endolytic transglycosylase MltG [Chloroflexota bacterium]
MDLRTRRIILAMLCLGMLLTLSVVGIPALAARSFGPPAAGLTWPQVVQYSARLLWADGLLSRPLDPGAPEKEFEILPGETVASVCDRLEREALVINGSMMRDYLIYTGQDTSLQAGRYRLSAAMSIADLAGRLQDATPTEVDFVVLPGWRIEEIAATLPTSGLSIAPAEFVAAAASPRGGFEFLTGAGTTEGFLYPDSYVLPRTTSTEELLEKLIRNFALHLSIELQEGFAAQGLSAHEAVILASIVQREAVQAEEAPLIASVYLNRLHGAMRLDADPTVQYALGFSAAQQTWWTNPLSLDDLKVASPYNTYLVNGLPPAPIANPGAGALQAIAVPAAAPFFYFSARCDGSGYHVFAESFQEHLGNLCP